MPRYLIWILPLLVLIALYLAAAGWVRVDMQSLVKENARSGEVIYDGITFEDAAARDLYIAKREAESYFPWTSKLPHALSLIITAVSFGFLGGIVRLLFEIIYSTAPPKMPLVSLALSGMMGLPILGISYVIPSALVSSEVTVRPLVLLFLCLLGGMCSDQAVLWIREQCQSFFQGKHS